MPSVRLVNEKPFFYGKVRKDESHSVEKSVSAGRCMRGDELKGRVYQGKKVTGRGERGPNRKRERTCCTLTNRQRVKQVNCGKVP